MIFIYLPPAKAGGNLKSAMVEKRGKTHFVMYLFEELIIILKIKKKSIIKEPKEIDFSIKHEPWSEEELIGFRKIISIEKHKNIKKIENK